MTTAPTPSDAERLARGLEEGFCGHAAWLQPAAAELRRQQAEVESLRAERDEADRRAGAAERSAAAFHEDHQRFEQVRRRMKEQWGVDDRVSFDVVWQQALDAKQALAELEARKPLPLSDDDRLRLRSDVARAIWDVMREHEDRCGHALEDVEPKHQVWDCADAAIKAVHGITGGSS